MNSSGRQGSCLVRKAKTNNSILLYAQKYYTLIASKFQIPKKNLSDFNAELKSNFWWRIRI